MAYAEERTVKDRKTKKITTYWSGRWKRPNGTYGRVEGRFATDKAAIKAGELLEAKAAVSPLFVDPRRSRVTLGVWAVVWFAELRGAPTTASYYRYLWRKIIAPRWENTAIGEITWWDVKNWAVQLEDSGYCYDTVTTTLALMTNLLSGAVDANRLETNRLLGQKRPPRRTSRTGKVWPTPDQAIRIAERCPREADRLRVLMASWLGMRFGELAALHRDNCLKERTDVIDGRVFVRHVVVVDSEVGNLRVWPEVCDDGRERLRRELAPPKSERGAREIDVPPFLVSRLRALMEADDRPYPLSGPRGGWCTKSTWSVVIRSACDGETAYRAPRRAAGWAPILPGMTLHGCRHAHRTWMDQGDHLGDVPLVLIRERMGHSRARGMDGVYAHPTPVMRHMLLGLLERLYENGLRVITGQPLLPADTYHDRLPGLSQEAVPSTRRHRIKLKSTPGTLVTRTYAGRAEGRTFGDTPPGTMACNGT